MENWWNVDLRGGDESVDLACGRLPWRDSAFEAAVAQHVVEHLELHTELVPLLRELHRVLEPGGELWLSCPDMEVICEDYVEDRLDELLQDRWSRKPEYSLRDLPISHFVNDLFHQGGMHKNLFDYELMRHLLIDEAGFRNVERTSEEDLLERFERFPPRDDDRQSLYVVARV